MAAEEDGAGSLQPPQHPVPHLQGPFEESMMESMIEPDDGEQKIDPVIRRRLLLQGEKYERVCAGRWKQRPGEKFHPLWKLSAQLSFGIHLLARGLAKSEDEVMRILQSHVDDVDGFIERTTEDFDLAQSDVDDRLRYLRLPLEHVDIFDHMLEDRAFRSSIVEGNEKIEHIVDRTSEAIKDAMKDVQKGIDATGALGKYLTGLKATWIGRTPELEAVYSAMLGNVEGWTRAFVDLHLQGNRLAISLVQLAGIIAEMQRRAGVASRKILVSLEGRKGVRSRLTPVKLPYDPVASDSAHPLQRSATEGGHQLRSASSPRLATPAAVNELPNKPLPLAPDLMTTARHASRNKLIQEEKLRTRSANALREQEKIKAPLNNPQRKVSMADKVRSVTKLGTHSTPKPKSVKTQNTKPPVPEQLISPPIRSSKVGERNSSARSPVLVKSRERDPRRHADAQQQPQMQQQPEGPIELPAEVPHGVGDRQDMVRRAGLQMRLGSKNRNKEPNSGHSPSKPLNLFRRSPQSPQSTIENTISPTADVRTQSQSAVDSSAVTTEPSQILHGQLSQQSEPAPQLQSPDPGLPTPPGLASRGLPHGAENRSYTALPDVLGTAQKAKTVKASLRLTLPTHIDVDAEKTPKPFPLKLPDSSQLQPDESRSQGASEDQSSRKSALSSLGEPGPEETLGDDSHVPEHKLLTTQDDEKTPIASQQSYMQAPFALSRADEDSSADAVDAPLTSATMRSFSDFYKLPPQHASPTPPPATPDESELPPPLATLAVTSAIDESNPTDIQGEDTETSIENKVDVADARRSSSTSVRSHLLSHQRRSSGHKRLSLKAHSQVAANQSGIFDLIASTPPHSPIHTRASSDVETFTSKILAPPDQAPPPPAPGGRSMINPDYASAGALEGEKRSKRGSTISTNGWKKVFSGHGSGGPSSNTSAPNGDGATSMSESGNENEEIQMSANLMSGKGNDVLWYKGMGKDGLWVSGV